MRKNVRSSAFAFAQRAAAALRLKTAGLAAALMCVGMVMWGGVAWGQTNPTAQSVPDSQAFGSTTFSSMPTGWAAWNGLSGSTINTQSLAEGSTPNGNATITAVSTVQTTGGCYGYATSSNGRAYIQNSGNATNGVNQFALAINTTGDRKSVV